MKKVTKKELARKIEALENFVDYAENMLTQLNHALPEPLDIKHWRDEQADHDELMEILDSKEPKLKQLDQSVFDGLDAKWRFAAVDSNGEVRLQMSRPVLNSTNSIWVCCGQPEKSAGMEYDTTDWQNSLIERDKVELTGNALCLKLLNLDLDVMCDVKDGDYRLIFAHDGEFFISHNKGERECHKNVTPISSYGEPLTAADVGL